MLKTSSIMRPYTLCLVFLSCLWVGCVCAQSFVSIVAADGSGQYVTVQEAVDACPADGRRHVIFVKNGVYAERVNLPKGKLISLLGESIDGVVVTNDRDRGKNSPYKNFRDITTMQCQGDDFYMENLTVANTAGDVGQAEAHFIAGARQVYRHCRFTGFQDTQRTKNGASAYLTDCWIEGAVDFIYGDGLMYYDHCTLRSVRGGGYLTAPAECAFTDSVPASDGHPLHYGYIFRSCRLTADRDVPAGSYYLGRPWKEGCAAYFLACELGTHINSRGWHEWDGRELEADFAEWGSRDAEGRPVDTSGRVAWSRRLAEADVRRLTPESVFARLKTCEGWLPAEFLHSEAPAWAAVKEGVVEWAEVPGAIGYLVYCDGRFVAAVDSCFYAPGEGRSHLYTVKAVSAAGVTSCAVHALGAVAG